MKDKERDKLIKEIEKLMGSKLGYTELNRLDEIIKELESNELKPIKGKFSVEDGWREFQSDYLIRLSNHKNKKPHKSIKKLFSVVAVALIMVLCINIISVMAGIDIIASFTKWTAEIFNLNSDENSVVNESEVKNFESISKLEEYIGKNIPIPEYMPQGYELNSVEFVENGKISVTYKNETGKSIRYLIYSIKDKNNIAIEKNDKAVKNYNSGSYIFNLFENNNWQVIQWNDNENLYYIAGKFSEEEAINIMNEIE